MKIAIDIRAACGEKKGKGWYTYHLVRELLKLDSRNEYLLYTDHVSAECAAFGNAAPLSGVRRSLEREAPNAIKIIGARGVRWHFAVIADLKKEGIELFFAPTSFIIPAFLPKGIISIITVHDLVAFLHPKLHQTKATILEKLFLKRALKKAQCVLVPSEQTKKDLIAFFHYPSEKITITHLAADERFSKPAAHQHAVKEKYHLPEKYILTVAGLEPRKNVSTLLDAFEKVHVENPGIKLVIVGGVGWKSAETLKRIERADSIIFIKNCPEEDLPALYQQATVFVFPSLYEGFGLPVLEAMTAGVPVICSNTSSLPEVAGDAAILFDPKNSDELAGKITQLLENKNIQKELSEKGKKRADNFSWHQTALKSLAAFGESVL